MQKENQYLEILKANKEVLQKKFSVSSLVVFGSIARGDFSNESDVDVFVQMPAQMVLVVGVKQYLESILNRNVDVIRDHKNLNPFLKQQIEKDGITIFAA